MASIYKNGKYYYISVSYDGKRQTKSLGTKSYEIAKKLKPFIEIDILSDLSGVKKRNAGLSFPELADKFLKENHNWSKGTYDLIELILRSYINGTPRQSIETNVREFETIKVMEIVEDNGLDISACK